MTDYQKVKKIQKLSNLVGCMKRIQAKRIELLLLVGHFIIIILCLINLLTIPWSIIRSGLKGLRIVILIFFVISLICVIYNQIVRKKNIITIGYYFCVSFFGSLISQGLIIINFIFLLISCIIVVVEVKGYTLKHYDHKSILIIDIVSLIIIFVLFFLWYSAFLLIYAKTDDSIKVYVEKKLRYFQAQNQKIVNVDLNEGNIKKRYSKNYIKNNIDKNNIVDDSTSTNKIEINEKQIIEKNIKNIKKEADISSDATK